LFRTRCGNAPSESDWSWALQNAHAKAKVHHIAVYDYRHAAATHWLGWGMALAEVAKRLGDDIKTVVAYYINAMEGDEESGNVAVTKGLDQTRGEVITPR
jgi:site-specific recombinase XerD